MASGGSGQRKRAKRLACTNTGVEGNHCCVDGFFSLFFGQETLKKVEIGPGGERFGLIVGAADSPAGRS